MLKPSALLLAALLLVGLALPAATARAGTLTATGSLGVSLGALPPILVPGGPVSIVVSSGTGGFTVPASLFAANVILPPELFTGVELISSLNVSAVNGTISQAAGGATGVVGGMATVGVLGGLINLAIPLDVGGGSVVTGGAAALAVTVTNAFGWSTGPAQITGITTTTAGTAVVNTVTVAGFDERTTAHNGAILLVTPVRVLTNAAGNLPLIGRLRLDFTGGEGVPEPGTLLLLGSGVAGLLFVARRRQRR